MKRKRRHKKEELTQYQKLTLQIQLISLISYIIISIIMILITILRG